jgi:hypothetical protein
MSEIEGKRPFVIIGTSGSTDYLKDTTGDRRYWPVSTGRVEDPPIDRARADADARAFMESTVGKRLVEGSAMCDGLHDEGAPAHYLCSRCFPDPRTDLGAHDGQDESEEME